MSSSKDVAQYILEKMGPISAIKLQKLVYYSQAWSLVWDAKPIFKDRIEAWANGPVAPDLFYAHQGQFIVTPTPPIGDSNTLDEDARETIDVIIRDYGGESPQWLVELTHLEEPWKNARGNYRPGERCNNEITHGAMAEYYSGL